jgi:glycerophosphodiester phosphodiesterase
MRFGRDLHKHQIPEWASSYVRYAQLKKLSKFAAKATIEEKADAAHLLQELTVTLRSDIADVETFYHRQYAILE